jgi:predicted RNA-binding Zn-ribbon protein involved in translation (DUF1610 family)
MDALTFTCPECGAESDRVVVTAPAAVEIRQLVIAEVSLDELAQGRADPVWGICLPDFELLDLLEIIDDHLDHYGLELTSESPRTEFRCYECAAVLAEDLIRPFIRKEEAA